MAGINTDTNSSLILHLVYNIPDLLKLAAERVPLTAHVLYHYKQKHSGQLLPN